MHAGSLATFLFLGVDKGGARPQGLLSPIKAVAQCSSCCSSESWMDHTIQAMLSPPKLLGAPQPPRMVGLWATSLAWVHSMNKGGAPGTSRSRPGGLLQVPSLTG